jgi:enamine deaminase RidA (YjgF/YER057c/UK114 family)
MTHPNVERLIGMRVQRGFTGKAREIVGGPTGCHRVSELLVEIFGDKGKHSRTALGAAALPLNVAVEINLIVEIGD